MTGQGRASASPRGPWSFAPVTLGHFCSCENSCHTPSDTGETSNSCHHRGLSPLPASQGRSLLQSLLSGRCTPGFSQGLQRAARQPWALPPVQAPSADTSPAPPTPRHRGRAARARGDPSHGPRRTASWLAPSFSAPPSPAVRRPHPSERRTPAAALGRHSADPEGTTDSGSKSEEERGLDLAVRDEAHPSQEQPAGEPPGLLTCPASN